jgi:hypothetical protein
MDYKDKYIEYKIKYLELKNIDTNNQIGGGKNKLLFIMFPGNGVTKNGWDTIDFNSKTGAIKRNNFIKEIKKLGEIYFYEPKYYNIYHYNGNDGYDKWYSKDINFTKDDIDIDNICENIYNDVKDFNGKIVLLGHSMGSYFVYYFSQKYASKCLFGIIIDGMLFFSPPNFNNKKKFNNDIKKYTKYTDKDIDELRKEVLNSNKKSIDELGNVYFSNIVSYEKIIKNFKTFKTPIISFCNFEIIIDKTKKEDINYYNKANRERINENNYMRKYNKSSKFKIIDFVNKTHFLHLVEESKDIILENIKLMITKYNK